MRTSRLAKNLRPYLRETIEDITRNGIASSGSGSGSLTAHALSGAYHTGILDVPDGGTGASTAAAAASSLGLGTEDSPLFSGLTVNGSIATTGTVDGIDISVFAGASFLMLGTNAQTANERVLTIGDGLDGIDAGAGSTYTVAVDVTDFIDTLYGLTEASNNIRINLAGISGLEFSAGALRIDDSIAGAGLVISSKVLAVGQGNGLTVTADAVNLTTPGGLTATTTNVASGNHTHSVDASANPGATTQLMKTDANGTFAFDTDTLYVSATQDAVWINSGTPDGSSAFKVASAATNDITVYIKQIAGQTADLQRWEDSSGAALILLQEDGDLESGNPGFVSGLTGWQISHTGDVEFNNGWFRGELHASVFVIDEIHATGGTLFVATAAKLLENTATGSGATSIGLGMENGDVVLIENADSVLMEVSDTFALDVEDPPSGHAQIFSVGDTLRMKTWTGSGVFDNWLSVTAIEDQTTFYRYYVRRVSGTGTIFPAGTAVVSYGYEGDGRILLTSDQNFAPYIDIFTVGPQPWSGLSGALIPHVRIGRLDGVGLVGTEQYGIVMGTDLSDTSLDAQYIVASDQQLKLNNVDLTIFNASNNPTVSIASSGRAKFGTDTDAAATTLLDVNPTAGTLKIGDVANGANVTIYGVINVLASSSGIGNYTDAGALAEKDNIADVQTTLTSGYVQVGSGTKDSTLNGWNIGAGEIVGQASGVDQVVMGTNGEITAGAGNVEINADGIGIVSAAAYSDPNAYKFLSGGSVIGSIWMEESATLTALTVDTVPVTSKNTWVSIRADANSTQDATILLRAVGPAVIDFRVISDFGGINRFEFNDGALRLDEITAPSSNPSVGGYLYVDNVGLKVRFANGTIATLATA